MDKPNLIIMASSIIRITPDSPLPNFVRDYEKFLKKFTIHSTKGTANTILSTGMYELDRDVKRHSSGRKGGVTELAAMAAKKECVAAILFQDPTDPLSDAVENRAFKRICILQKIRLITTYAGVLEWVKYESESFSHKEHGKFAYPKNWENGRFNYEDNKFKRLPIEERTLSLIAHDNVKKEMVQFVNRHKEILSNFHRIITTGTTGILIRLLFADKKQEKLFIDELGSSDIKARVVGQLESISGGVKGKGDDFVDFLASTRQKLGILPYGAIAGKIMPLESGPKGGDVLVADQVLQHTCHNIVFFQDTQSPHPHTEDIRLLERTCQLPNIYCGCVSDVDSGTEWVNGLTKELDFDHLGDEDKEKEKRKINLEEELRKEYGLRDVIIVNRNDDEDSNELGYDLARVSAGYLHYIISNITQEKEEVKIGIAGGWMIRQIIDELQRMDKSKTIELPEGKSLSGKIKWYPTIGILLSKVTLTDAGRNTEEFCEIYGGDVERDYRGFNCPGILEIGSSPPQKMSTISIIKDLNSADIILTTGTPWDENSSIYNNAIFKPGGIPSLEQSVGLLSGVFLDEKGNEVKSTQYSLTGLGYDAFRSITEKGVVILVCGGKRRHKICYAALKGKLVSVLITNSMTAEWLLDQKKQHKDDLIAQQPPGEETKGTVIE